MHKNVTAILNLLTDKENYIEKDAFKDIIFFNDRLTESMKLSYEIDSINNYILILIYVIAYLKTKDMCVHSIKLLLDTAISDRLTNKLYFEQLKKSIDEEDKQYFKILTIIGNLRFNTIIDIKKVLSIFIEHYGISLFGDLTINSDLVTNNLLKEIE